MSLLTIAWSMVAAACGMMGLSHIVLCFKGQRPYVHLLSSVMAFSAAAGALVELALLQQQAFGFETTLVLFQLLEFFRGFRLTIET